MIKNKVMVSVKGALEAQFGITRLGSINCGVVKLEQRIMTPWKPYDQRMIAWPYRQEVYPFLEAVAGVIEDLDHCQYAWRYSCWTAIEHTADDPSNSGKTVYCHMVDFQDKAEALMFKLRMR